MTIFRGNSIIIYAYIRKEEFQINDLIFQPIIQIYSKKLE